MVNPERKLYKVLVKGRSCHGGDQKWPLPKGKTPGEWVSIDRPVLLCNTGFHLTTEPYNWFEWGCDVYEAEGAGDWDVSGTLPHKIVFQRARLLRKVPKPGWLLDSEEFVKSIQSVGWFSGVGALPEGARLFDTRAAAAAWDAARDAARDAVLLARCLIVSDVIAPEHLAHARLRWSVWEAGYGVAYDVRGVLYCYRRPA